MRRALAWALGALLVVLGIRLVALSVVDRSPGATRDRAVETLRYLSSDLEAQADAMQRLFPEGRLFTAALTGIAWSNVGLEAEGHAEPALEGARGALAVALAPRSTEPFGPTAGLPFGTFYDAWTTRLQTGVVRLAQTGGRVLESDTSGLGERCARLRSALEDGPLFPDSYPGMAWPADAVVGAAALEGCARTVDPSARAVARAWVSRAVLEADPATGLIPHAVWRPDPRGSSSALMVPFLAEVDPSVGRDQLARALRAYPAWLLGAVPAIREYPRGTDGRGDVDSGPLVFGMSAPASVVMAAASRSSGAPEIGSALLASADLIGWPVTVSGRRRYAAGALPVGDAFVAWSATVPVGPYRHRDPFEGRQWRWRLIGAVPAVLGVAVVVLERRGRL